MQPGDGRWRVRAAVEHGGHGGVGERGRGASYEAGAVSENGSLGSLSMTAVGYAEIAASLVTFLDVTKLRVCEGCLCSTPVVPEVVHGTNRNGPFLVLETHEAELNCLCVPLYGSDGPTRIQLDQSFKTGPGRGWREGLSFFDTREFWLIPFSCFVDASHIEFSVQGDRQRYGQTRPEALAAIASHKRDSGSPFIPISN